MASRRQFLQTTAHAGLVSSLGAAGSLLRLSPLTAAETAVTPEIVQFTADIEPVVRLIENTPREKCFEMMAEQLRRGLPYRQFLAALFLAGIRNVNPQPPGFKFHCVFVIHAAHQLSLDAPVQERLLPLFWALDNFKASQAKDVQEGDFRLKPVRGALPPPEKAWSEFHQAMDDWDEERADRAIVSLVRHRGAHEIIEQLWQYGARDYRNIGHKAIFVANTWKTLQTIGWRHAEPALRSLILGLLDFGKSETVNRYAFEDQSFLPNLELAKDTVKRLPGNWTHVRSNAAASKDLLAMIRAGRANDACAWTVEQLVNGRTKVQSAWDAVHLAAGELMMRKPGIFGIHTVTSTNGLRYAFETAADPETRLVMLLQGIGWMCQFRNFMSTASGGLKDVEIDKLQPARPTNHVGKTVEEIFAELSSDRSTAAAKAMALANQTPRLEVFKQTARSLIFRKGTDAHDYKYSASIFEDYNRVSKQFRPHMLATAVYHLRGSTLPDSAVMQRAQAAIQQL